MTELTQTDHPNALLAKRMLDAVHTGDEHSVRELVHRDHVDHAPAGDLHGPDGVVRAMHWIRATLSDIEVQVADVIATDDRVVVRGSIAATQSGELLGLPPTGRRFLTETLHVWRVEDGLLAEHWMFRDDAATLRQIGAGR